MQGYPGSFKQLTRGETMGLVDKLKGLFGGNKDADAPGAPADPAAPQQAPPPPAAPNPPPPQGGPPEQR